jgi:hypothetical protein
VDDEKNFKKMSAHTRDETKNSGKNKQTRGQNTPQ